MENKKSQKPIKRKKQEEDYDEFDLVEYTKQKEKGKSRRENKFRDKEKNRHVLYEDDWDY